MDDSRKKPSKNLIVDDRLVRIIGIPFFGIVIPAATGLVSFNDSFSDLLWPTVYFILMAFLIWQGNRWLLFRFYPVVFETNSKLQKYLLMIGLNIFYSGPISIFMLWLWYVSSGRSTVDWEVIALTVLVIVICVIFITNIYEKALFTQQSENEKIKMEQLDRSRVEAELEALKNQIDPHFMFNSLNSLSYLVEHDQQKAQEFISNLADVYRYILKSKDQSLILLKDEITFVRAYADLMELRYGKGFRLHVTVDANKQRSYLIPPVSLLVAVENAVKHNQVSESDPLAIEIADENDIITVKNLLSERKNVRPSTGTGLINLIERFEKILSKPVNVINDGKSFTLEMPMIKLTN